MIEIIVVVAILGVMGAWVAARVPTGSRKRSVSEEIQLLRSRAIRSRHAITTWISVGDTTYAVTARWDGSLRTALELHDKYLQRSVVHTAENLRGDRNDAASN